MAKVIRVMEGPQSLFVESTAPYPAYVAGRRGGKTSASVIKMVNYVYTNPGCYGAFTVPTLDDIDRILLPKMQEFFGEGKSQWWFHKDKAKQFVFPDAQATVFIRTASEPDSLRGMTLAFAAMDEIGTGDQEDAFHILEPSVSQPGFPHQLWVTSTPNVDRPWIRKLWKDKINPIDNEPVEDPEDYPLFTTRTIDNWHLDEKTRQRLINSFRLSRKAAQELGGEFITVEGLAFELNEDIHYRWPKEQLWRRSGIAGLDMGGTEPTALIEWAQDMSGRFWALSEFYKRDADEYEWVEWCRQQNIRAIICDPTASDKMLVAWRKKFRLNIQRGDPAIRTFEGRKTTWKTGLTLRCTKHTIEECRCPNEEILRNGLPNIFISRNCPNLWGELTTLAHAKPKGRDYTTDNWTPNASDHAYDAGAYGLSYFGRTMGRPNKPFEIVRVA